ncbi:transcription-repair coupling factor (superfamily II helicase) [Clostridium tetanomorphum]|uniref:Transcription-repair-coupling factor n=1 Tax=Clostridium tetanomorphum TaxID=1553 RepID=A0A923J2B7_CLOTT|nr:transcription-repair coupling factor [Clostridium tetanomorphum]KAJ50827.1 transcription-repair coupling factor [Clostridium tetanomorphum DSM 665]MBC2398318.1 transcription-repair coupling factor [Clostridium tetanomorphum]MBP1865470.1 transcription-repair coupling factor (superfamily II helicase) [Clostridium tetanomorphum]NRS86416.1 transcription-repair coupling factor (superfamily II helicase) [Clostridium tetanomorphum]NRZ95555.1 transcription-repair coupling factor (superfamily II hel
MRLSGVLKPLKNSSEFKIIKNSIDKRKFPLGIFGLSESSRSYILKGMYDEIDKPLLILTHSDVEARNIYEDLALYITEAYYLPTKEVVFYNIDAISGDLRWERLKVIKNILHQGKKVVIASIEAIASSCIPMNLYKKYSFKFSVGDILDYKDLGEKLIHCGYERVDLVDSKGQFSIRGGILDIYPPTSMEPYRIELFGDEIDSIRTFNTESQRSIDKKMCIEVFPAKEIILNKDNIENACENIQEDLKVLLNNFKSSKNKEAYEKLKIIINKNLESLKQNWNFETIDSYLPYFYDKMTSFLDYFQEWFIVIDDVQRCEGKLNSVYFEFEENYKSFLQRGDILPKQAELLIPKNDILNTLEEGKLLTLSSIPKALRILQPKAIINFSEITLHNYHGQLDLLIEDIKEKKQHGYKILILSGTRPRGERLVNTLRERGIESVYKDIVEDISPGEVVVTFGSQLKGYEYPDLKLCIISDKEVFGEAKKKSSKRVNKKGLGKIRSFAELKPGDYVVHVNHGIGIYKGIKQLDIGGHKKDYLELSYYGDDKLYVPVEQLDMVQKYIGSEGNAPKINKLGSAEWTKAKTKVKKSIEEIAQDLVKLYAVRSTLKGYRFSKDTVWQRQFEEEFPYEETPDQITAIEDIKKDMQSDKAMDRLLCGDVGYGKTEVALRAAFKAVMDGKQVALLVPTTILAQQHYNNLVQRFSDFPVTIDMISRFKTPAQQKKTIKAIKEGRIDILIGTHRILQKDLQFKDLGLLIIDEEQRFGVKHKEKIKSLKKNIDVLTLSATPIPRTLHMSLVGVRDISIIETPPEERHPIQTYVVEYNDQLIRDAILREVNRGGQIYFVYNRVESIKEMESYLSKLIPEARIGVAHGQMQERELESVIMDFMKNEYDILLATTIIETGMDIQNVNTMIIYDADKMGLSQLYQLRGRVGRSNRIAYCYLTYKKDKILTEVAEKRLKAIKEFTELGSGFKIALKDLEIRGAGNMMGSSQHGHMASIGYDLYCRMLEDTIKKFKGEIDEEPIETTVELKLDAFIPTNYIKDETQKIEIYKKIAAINSNEDFMDVQEELEDRFSDVPPSVQNLMDIAYIRSIAKGVGIEEIKEKGEEVLIRFDNKERLNQSICVGIKTKYNKVITFKFGDKPMLGYKLSNIKKEDLLANLKEFILFIEETCKV